MSTDRRIPRSSLTVRSVVSHVFVAAVALLAFYVVIRLLIPALFDQGMARGPMGARGQGESLRGVVTSAITTAALVGGLIAVATAVGIGWLLSRRLLLPITQVRDATRRISSGDYAARVPLPPERELAELATDVNTMGERLSQTERTRVQLIADVAHEMRTPLTVLDGYVEGMIDGVIEVTPSSLQDMATETRRLRRLAEDFSSLSKAQERRFDLILEPRDLADIVTAAATRMGPQLEDEGIELALSVPPLPVTADEDRIMQVVTNLLGNAVAATGRGGHIRIAGRQEAGWAVVDVADTGVGLAPDDVERVFERFYRAHQGRASGSGIGLTISRELMRAHGGELSAHSDGPGQGATFSVWLPIRRT